MNDFTEPLNNLILELDDSVMEVLNEIERDIQDVELNIPTDLCEG